MSEPRRPDRRIVGESTCRCGSVWPGEIGANGCPDCVSPASQFQRVEQSVQPFYDWLVASGCAWGALHRSDAGSGCHDRLFSALDAYSIWLEARIREKLVEGKARKRISWEVEPGIKRRAKTETEARRLIRHHEHKATRERLYAVLRALHGIGEWSETSRNDNEMLLAIVTEISLRREASRMTEMDLLSRQARGAVLTPQTIRDLARDRERR